MWLLYYCRRLFDWVLPTSARVSVFIILLLLVKLVLRNKIGTRLHYRLWFVVIISLLVPTVPQSPFSVYNSSNEIAIQLLQTSTEVEIWDKNNATQQTVLPQNDSTSVSNNHQSPGTTKDFLNPPVTNGRFIYQLFCLLWIAGIVILAVFAIGVNNKFARRINGKPVADQELLATYYAAKQALHVKRKICLIETQAVSTPCLFGFVRPRLLIPVGIENRFAPAQLYHIFVHELVHFKRKDILLNWIAQGLLIFHWFNPLFWYAYFKMREDQELACDTSAVLHIGTNQAKEYALTLIKLVESISQAPRIASLTCLSAPKSHIKTRIIKLKEFKKASIRWSVLGFTVIILLAFTTLTSADINTKKTKTIKEILTSADNLVKHKKYSEAIDSYESILPIIFLQLQDDQLYALTQYKVGYANYALSKVKDKDINLFKAIGAFQEALKFRTFTDHPSDYAATQIGLGTAYCDLSAIQDKEINLNKAINAYQEGIKINTMKKDPFSYATTKVQLSGVYSKLADFRDKKENLDKAVKASDEALKVLTVKDHLWYAAAHDHSGNAHLLLADIQDKVSNLETAIKAYEEALKTRPVEVAPEDDARTLRNLAETYTKLSEIKDKEENADKAIKANNQALEIMNKYGIQL